MSDYARINDFDDVNISNKVTVIRDIQIKRKRKIISLPSSLRADYYNSLKQKKRNKTKTPLHRNQLKQHERS